MGLQVLDLLRRGPRDLINLCLDLIGVDEATGFKAGFSLCKDDSRRSNELDSLMGKLKYEGVKLGRLQMWQVQEKLSFSKFCLS